MTAPRARWQSTSSLILAPKPLRQTKKINSRQEHINLLESCIERGGNSTNHKGVLAQFLDTTIPYGTKILLCHACNNAKCSNPKHLYWGTPKENVEDAILAGTFHRPEKGHKGTPRSEETRKKISTSLRGKPSNNKSGINGITKGTTQKGYTYTRKFKQMWITDGVNNTRIPLSETIPDNWKRGRTIYSGIV